MAVVISLLRAVNLAGHNMVKMDALRDLYAGLGLRDVQTYVQSGNVIFSSSAKDLARLRKRIEAAIEECCGFRTDAILRTVGDLEAIVRGNPFTGIEPGKLLVHFLSCTPDADACAKVPLIKVGPEELHLDGSNLYIHYANGVGRSKLTAAVLERTLKTPGTARNWNTVTKLLELGKRIR